MIESILTHTCTQDKIKSENMYHIDHIKTFSDVSKGVYTLEEVCHYTNLQILPAEINLSKSGTSWIL
jgi:hypothetical protein